MRHRWYFIKIILLSIFLTNSNYSFSQDCYGIGEQVGKFLDSAYKKIKDWTIYGFRVFDPNELQGQPGFAAKQWVSVKNRMSYRINFENNGDFANAPVQNAYLHFPIPAKIDINTLRLGNYGFGNFDFEVPPNTSTYTKRLDLRDSLGIYVDITAGVDITSNEVFWFFKSIDPVTGIAPNDGRGFLAVSDTGAARLSDTSSTKGQGYAEFYIAPSASAATGDTVQAQVSITFDFNEALTTNTWINTIDALPPVSKIMADSVSDNIITLKWNGQDDAGGSGVRDYALYYSENNGPFILYKAGIPGLSADFAGTPGNSYCFFTLASDNTGNQEPMKNDCELSLILSTNAALPVTWLYFTGKQLNNDVLLNWATASEKNTREFVVERSLDGSQFGPIGSLPAAANSNQVSNYQYLDKYAASLNENILYYRLRQSDLDGRITYSSIAAVNIRQNSTIVSVKAVPNPFSQNISLVVKNVPPSNAPRTVTLYSAQGQLLYKQNIIISGSNAIPLTNLPPLASGIYFLHTVINNQTYSMKLTKY